MNQRHHGGVVDFVCFEQRLQAGQLVERLLQRIKSFPELLHRMLDKNDGVRDHILLGGVQQCRDAREIVERKLRTVVDQRDTREVGLEILDVSVEGR